MVFQIQTLVRPTLQCSRPRLPQSIFDKMTENRSYNVIQLDNNVANKALLFSIWRKDNIN